MEEIFKRFKERKKKVMVGKLKTCLPGELSSAEKRILSDFKDRLRKRFDGEIIEVVLYGSRARGEGHEESDIDVAVLVKEMRPRLRQEIYDIAYEIFLESDLNISPLVITREKFEWLKDIGRGIALDIEREGIRI